MSEGVYILYQIIPPLLPQNINEIMIDSVKDIELCLAEIITYMN